MNFKKKAESMDTLSKIIKGRRSIRQYRDEKVPREKLEELFAIASYAPSSCNLQAWHFIVVDDDEIRKRVVREGKVNRQVLSVPTFIVATYNRNVTREHYANYQSLAAAVQNFILLAHAEGLGTLWVCNFKNEGGIREVLGIPKSHRVLAIIEVGYPREIPKPPKRNPPEKFVSYNGFQTGSEIPETTFLEDWEWKSILDWQKRFVSRGYELEKVTERETNILSSLMFPHLKGRKTLELYAFSAILTSAINRREPIVDHHFAAQEIRDAAIGFNHDIEKQTLFVNEDPDDEDLRTYENFMLLNRVEHMPFKIVDSIIKKLAAKGDGTRLLILFRNKYSWFGIYDFVVRQILRKGAIDDSYFGSLRHIGPWRLRSKGWIGRILKRHHFEVSKSYGLLCLPAYRFAESEWITSKRRYRFGAAVLAFFFELLEMICKWTRLNGVIGEQILLVCRLKADRE